MNPKAYFIDIDGTLLSGHGDKVLKLEDKHALKNAIKRKTYIVLSTGRSLPDAKKVWEQYKDDSEYSAYVIVNNGSAIWDLNNDELLFDEYMDEKTYRGIIEFSFEKKWAVKNSLEKVFWTKSFVYNTAFKFTNKLTTKSNYKDALYLSESARKLGILTWGTKRQVAKCAKMIDDKFPNADVAISGPGLYIEVNKKNVNKGEALKFLANKLEIDLKDTVHIGDSMNDASAFKVAGAGVVMANGMKDLKKMATHTTTSQKKSGVANTIKSFGTI